ncbi:unnamed protein product [Caenorhabditis angaria]|uniref:Uncharacterized protein n=1 Tax=Caenorhabditis angaria TaxID=860376 RepID=A0A9P1IA70_9PELO|nr:unnamed protein product [Caenorhabditis angaria]
MKSLILALFVLISALFVVSEAFPQQTRYRKSQPQEANIQPFIRFRKSASPASASMPNQEYSSVGVGARPIIYYYPSQFQSPSMDLE